MNKTAKILMLIVAIVIAIVAVLYFAKRIVAPPIQTSFPNAHLASLDSDIAQLDQHLSIETTDSIFDITLHAAHYFQREGFITIKESDDVIARLTKQYAPIFLQSATKHFDNSIWYRNLNNELRRRAEQLNGLRTQEGNNKFILTGEIHDRVDSVIHTIEAYDSAQKICEQTRFVNLDDAKKRVRKARDYAKMPKLCNCTTLVEKLNALPQRIGNSHVQNIIDLVNKMNNYKEYDENYFKNSLTKEVNVAIDEYEKHAYQIYGIEEKTVKEKAKELRKRAGDYWEEADAYYKSLKENATFFTY